jgi:predicted DNA-binding transcriptional regulator AlpA
MDIQFIPPKGAAALTSLSTRHISRLTEQGLFPKPIRLGEGLNGRLAYLRSEVEEWLRARLAERDGKGAAG